MTRRKKTRLTRPHRRQQQPAQKRRGAAWFWAAVGAALVLLIGGIVALPALREESGSETDVAVERGPVHVHGLGINPGDGALYIATHTGLWRVGHGERVPEPVGESRQDTMGFTVAGPDLFLGSGHPDNLDQPPLLGLIRSSDSGVTWNPISLLGQADFHVLRALDNRVYGYDVTNSRLMVSRDAGKTWAEHEPKAPVFDLVPDPSSPDRILATTEAGLLVSGDAGATWTRIGPIIGLLGWPAKKRLYLVSERGEVLLSSNGGRAWSRVGSIGGPPAAFLAETPRELYAAIHGGPVVRSLDGGRSWKAVTT
jgi:photosystem II stability/assembly factor-like uncharacterized protein